MKIKKYQVPMVIYLAAAIGATGYGVYAEDILIIITAGLWLATALGFMIIMHQQQKLMKYINKIHIIISSQQIKELLTDGITEADDTKGRLIIIQRDTLPQFEMDNCTPTVTKVSEQIKNEL